jgi:hypothetical protein
MWDILPKNKHFKQIFGSTFSIVRVIISVGREILVVSTQKFVRNGCGVRDEKTGVQTPVGTGRKWSGLNHREARQTQTSESFKPPIRKEVR